MDRAVRAPPASPVRPCRPSPARSCWQPPLPGGWEAADPTYYIGASVTWDDGDKLVHGQQGEVVGPATGENPKGKGLAMHFPGNKGTVDCYLSVLSSEPPVQPAGGDVER